MQYRRVCDLGLHQRKSIALMPQVYSYYRYKKRRVSHGITRQDFLYRHEFTPAIGGGGVARARDDEKEWRNIFRLSTRPRYL